MGATGNPSITRLATLQERKKFIEESLAKCNEELKQICLQEADLTGEIPGEMPLEPGETPPLIRRRVGTTYQFAENLIKNSNNEMITDLELQIQLHAHMAEAALDLANENNISKTLRRKHMADYQQHKIQYSNLQEKLEKEKQQVELKVKKKARPTSEDDNESFTKTELRQSIRSMNHYAYKNMENPYSRPEDLAGGFYALSINGYKNYMERKESYNNHIYNYQQTPQYHQHRPATVYNYSNIEYIRNHQPNERYYARSEHNFHTLNPHQIQPHQQYEQMNAGLGGYWKRLENGETVWCNASPDMTWQRDKRFGSLDRRKNKRLHKRVSPSVSNKSATLASVPFHVVEQCRVAAAAAAAAAAVKTPQVVSRRSQDNRQLIRTQSLGSVGGQTIDSVWQSDDNSSCDSDTRSINQNLRRQKQKEWKETSLDGPSPTHSVVSRSHSVLPSVISPEDQYISKPPLEIPAESNPSPRIETNIELFNNNNIPKNCTLVQAGHFKPYHEETKPFEMADWYKYSTKFKKSPVKSPSEERPEISPNVQKNLNETYDISTANHNFSPGRLDNSLNSTFDMSQANIAERFSDEMNAWYENRNLHINPGSSKSKSTATLV